MWRAGERRESVEPVARLTIAMTLIAVASANLSVIGALIAFVGLDGDRMLSARQIWTAGLIVTTLATGTLTPLIVAPGLMRIRRLARSRDRWERAARRDALTGLLNRFGFDERAQRELEAAGTPRLPVALAIADIDHFKAVNDAHGHDVGDEALALIASLLSGSLAGRAAVVGRRGGEEFAILILDCDETGARQAAELMRRRCEETPLAVGGLSLRLTVSFGVSARRGGREPLAALIARADAALYEAKRQGRNRVVVSTSASESRRAA